LFPSRHPRPPSSTLFPYTTLFRSWHIWHFLAPRSFFQRLPLGILEKQRLKPPMNHPPNKPDRADRPHKTHQSSHRQSPEPSRNRSEEHTSELQSPDHLVCRLLLEK